jgi:BNR repeat-like domain
MASASPTNRDLHEVATFTSSDGGNTWKLARVQKGQAENESYGDPHLAYGADGSVYLVTLRDNFRKANAGNTELARSRDNGKTWDRTTLLPWNDRPFLVTDGGGGERDGLIACYAAGSKPLVAVSRDGGQSFSAWKPLLSTGMTRGMGTGVRLSDGTLVVSYGMPPAAVTVARSTDGGQSYREAPNVGRYKPGILGLPDLASDPASPAYKDRLYLVWPDQTPIGKHVWLARSQDRGETWSRPVLLSEQPGEGEAATRYDSFLPAVSVNKAGVVGVMWYDSRNLPAKRRAWNIRFRASRDGGETWLPSVRVTDRESLFEEGARVSSTLPGDTAGLVADADGVFHAAWVDNRTGVRQIWTAAIRVESGSIDD